VCANEIEVNELESSPFLDVDMTTPIEVRKEMGTIDQTRNKPIDLVMTKEFRVAEAVWKGNSDGRTREKGL